MGLDLALMDFGGNTRSKILEILSIEWPLTAKEIHHKLTHFHGLSISYQAVHKILNELFEEQVLEKTGAKYSISLAMVRKSVEKIASLENQLSVSVDKFNPTAHPDTPQTIRFDSMTELSVFICNFLSSKKLVLPKQSSDVIGVFEYGWWPFIFEFKHIYLILKLTLACPKTFAFIRKKTPFGEWINEQYSRGKILCAPMGLDIPIEEDILLQGDYLIETKFDKESKKLIEKYYNKWHNLNDLFKEFGLRKEPKINATMKITRNPEMAKFTRNQLMQYFNQAKEKGVVLNA